LTALDGGEGDYVAGLQKVAKRIVVTGCTSFVPTVITQKEELYSKVSPSIIISV
jgi:N-acetylglucosamine-6-phosphate deacetylase